MKQVRWSCYCGRMFTTKSGRTRHMRKCPDVPQHYRDGWLARH